MTTKDEPLEIIAPGVSLQWLYDHHVAFFTVSTISQGPIRQWADKHIEIINGWPDDSPVMIIDDFIPAAQNVMFTPAIRAHTQRIIATRPEITIYAMTIVPKTFVAQIVTGFLHMTNNRKRIAQIAFSREEALVWTEKNLHLHSLLPSLTENAT